VSLFTQGAFYTAPFNPGLSRFIMPAFALIPFLIALPSIMIFPISRFQPMDSRKKEMS
jgi:hypothetical protein